MPLPRGYRKPSNDFRSLAELAERWLAVTGTSDAMTEQHSDPIDLNSQVTVPMLGQNAGMNTNIQDVLNQAGVELPSTPNIPQI